MAYVCLTSLMVHVSYVIDGISILFMSTLGLEAMSLVKDKVFSWLFW